jgi:hypothetical protein
MFMKPTESELGRYEEKKRKTEARESRDISDPEGPEQTILHEHKG